jgi:hypothetical protein
MEIYSYFEGCILGYAEIASVEGCKRAHPLRNPLFLSKSVVKRPFYDGPMTERHLQACPLNCNLDQLESHICQPTATFSKSRIHLLPRIPRFIQYP